LLYHLEIQIGLISINPTKIAKNCVKIKLIIIIIDYFYYSKTLFVVH